MLEIPMVVDQMIQQAIAQVMSPIWEESFSENSYRPRLPKLSLCVKILNKRWRYDGLCEQPVGTVRSQQGLHP